MFFKSPRKNPKNASPTLSDTARLSLFSSLPFDFFAPNEGAILFSNTLPVLLDMREPTSLADVLASLTPETATQLETALTDPVHAALNHTLHLKTRLGKILTARVTNFRIKEGPYMPLVWLYEDGDQHAREQTLTTNLNRTTQTLEELTNGLDALATPLWLANSLNPVAWCNTAYAAIFGESKANILKHQSLPDLTLLETNTQKLACDDLITHALKSKNPTTVQGRRIEGGKRLIYELRFEPVPARDLLLCHMVDISDHEETKRDLKRADAAQAKLLENLRTAIAIFNADQKLGFYNQAFSHLWGLEDSYLNSHPKLGDVLEKLRELRRLPEQSDFRAYKKGWLDWFTTLLSAHEDMLYLPNGNAIRLVAAPHPLGGIMLLFEDVTSSLTLETSYNTLMAVQRETIDSLPEGIAVFGHDGRLRLWNSTLSAMSLLPPEKLETKPHISELVDHLNAQFIGLPGENLGQHVQSLVLSRDETVLDVRRQKGDLLMTINANALPDGSVMLTLQDVTDRTRAEIALRERAEALQEAEQLKTDFLANVSYQFRTPLNAMTGFAEMLKLGVLGPLNEKQQAYAENILEAGSQLARLIDDILDLTSLEAGHMNLVWSKAEPEALIKSVKHIVHDWAGVKGIHFTCQLEPPLHTIETDEKRLKQMLITLLRQAISRCSAGGKVTLEARSCSQSGGLCLTITDTGTPIAPEVLKRVFSPFETIGRVAEDGLGLSLAKTLAEAMGGKLEAESLPTGNAFKLGLPPRVLADH